MSPFSIAKYRPSDAAAVRDIFPEFLREYAGLLPSGALFVARRGKHAVGFLFVKWFHEPCYFDESVRDYAEIMEAHVHPEYRNRGVATALVRRALREAVKQGCEAVYLVTDDFNAAAHRVYEKCGFARHNYVVRYKRALP